MIKGIIILSFLALVLCQSSVANTCAKPCYGTNISPCPDGTSCVKYSGTAPIQDGCATQCIKTGASDADVKAAFTSCTSPCRASVCSPDEVCSLTSSGCYNCNPICDTTKACDKSPCSIDDVGKKCAITVSANAVCVDNNCGGCKAEWYVAGNRVCQNSGSTCTPCNTVCSDGSKNAIDSSTGCPVCDKCTTVCPDLKCSNTVACPNGYAVNSTTGCPTCNCNQCSSSTCKLACPTGFKFDPTTKCQLCECAPPTCKSVDCSTTNTKCQYGYVVDANGCPTCDCKTCATPTCTTNTVCKNGAYVDSNGCPTCQCLPVCTNVCPNGYDFSVAPSNTDATTSSSSVSTTYCKCKCAATNCIKACPTTTGYVIDSYGCQTCDCVPNYSNCSKVTCDLACKYGYVSDSNGCQTCKCVEKPTVCPDIACNVKCTYGSITDSTGCPTCNCQPCPAFACSRYCEYGYLYDKTTGCQMCDCAPQPVCPTTSTSGNSGASSSVACNLDCAKGLATENGCPVCKCADATPCTACPKTSTTDQIKCPDGKVYPVFSDVCDKNTCSYVKKTCPIVIVVTVTTPLTDDAIKSIILAAGITNSADATVTNKKNSDGTTSYTLTLNQDGLNDGTNADKASSNAQTAAQESDPNAKSYVLSDGSSSMVSSSNNSFVQVIVPALLGLLLMFL